MVDDVVSICFGYILQFVSYILPMSCTEVWAFSHVSVWMSNFWKTRANVVFTFCIRCVTCTVKFRWAELSHHTADLIWPKNITVSVHAQTQTHSTELKGANKAKSFQTGSAECETLSVASSVCSKDKNKYCDTEISFANVTGVWQTRSFSTRGNRPMFAPTGSWTCHLWLPKRNHYQLHQRKASYLQMRFAYYIPEERVSPIHTNYILVLVKCA